MKGLCRCSLVIFAALLTGCGKTAIHKTDPRSIVFPFQYIGIIDEAHLGKPDYQPSGICFHSKRGTLFVVFDLGAVCEMKTDGTILNEKQADVIGLARVIWTDPEWISKTKNGKEADILHCQSGCDACLMQVMQGRSIVCAAWPPEKKGYVKNRAKGPSDQN